MLLSVKIAIGLGLIGAALIILGGVLGFEVLPKLIDDEIAKSVRLERSEQYERWEELPFALTFSIYFFNVVNAEAVETDAAKPVVEEVGPFVYKQYRVKKQVMKEDDHTMSYVQEQRYEFDPVASGGLSEDYELTMLNIPQYGVFQTAENTGQVSSVNMAVFAFEREMIMFHKITAKQYMFGGYHFCRVADLQGAPQTISRIFCNTLRGQVGPIKTMDTSSPDYISFSFFAFKNNADDGRYRVKTGMDDVMNTGDIVSWNGGSAMNTWLGGQDSTCNQIKGRDASIYPPHNNKDTVHDVFSSDICRSVKLDFAYESEYKGIEGYRSELRSDTFAMGSQHPDNDCLCIKQLRNLAGERECLPTGLADMTSCLGSPIALSFPHLLHVDPEYADTVIGLEPDVAKHTTYVEMQPDTGTPLRGGKRVQFNMLIRPITGLSRTQNLPSSVLPILWIEEGTALPDNLVQKIKDDFVSRVRMAEDLKWGLLITGIIVFVLTVGWIVYKQCVVPVRTLR